MMVKISEKMHKLLISLPVDNLKTILLYRNLLTIYIVTRIHR